MALLPTTLISKQHNDIKVFDGFFTNDLIQEAWSDCRVLEHGKDFIDKHGIWKGKKIARQTMIQDLPVSISKILDQACEIFDRPTKIVEVTYVELFLPWDIHCDLLRSDCSKPFYNLLIPFHDVESRTIIFDQTSDRYNDFWKYKQEHDVVEDPVPQDLWDQYLDMCWPEDRLYLSIKKILPEQRAGQLIAFRRNFFHSSDNFHKRVSGPKCFLQVIVDEI